MQHYIKNILKSALFILGLIALLWLSSGLLSPKSNNTEGGMIDPVANGILSEPKNSIDVLIIGDSETYSSMIPLKMWEEHGITSYCCGTSGQLLSYSEQFLHKAFQNQSPKIVILETNAVFHKITFDNVLLNRLDATFSVFTYHNRWKTLNENDFTMSANFTTINNTKGYWFTTATAPANDSNYMKPSSECEPIRSRNRFYVERMKKHCDDKGAKFILVSTPSTVNWNAKRHNSIQALAEKLSIEYIDMNMLREEIPIDWKTDSRDKGDHLNHFGAEKVTSYLGKHLSETGLLANHKNDGVYSAWNDALTDYQKTIAPAVSAK